jgi:Putative zinc-finger
MNHAEAEATSAVERYLLGEMGETEERTFEEHFFGCVDCAEDVRASTAFVENLRAVLSEPYEITSALRKRPSGRRLQTWVAPLAAAAAIVVALGLGYQNMALRHQVELANVIESPATYYLSETRSEMNLVVASKDAHRVSLLLNQVPGKAYPFYDCQLRDSSGKIVRSFRVRVMAANDEWQVPLPIEGLTQQTYTLKVRGAADQTGPPAQDVAEYQFGFEIR